MLTVDAPPFVPASEHGIGRRYGTAATQLRIVVWVLVLVPSRYIIGPLGSLGSPALVGGLFLLLAWAIGVLTNDGSTLRPCVPLRVVLAGLWATYLLSYMEMHRHGVPGDESGNADRLLIGLAAWTGIALTASEGLRNRGELLAVVRTVVDAVAVMALIAVLQFRIGWAATDLLDKIPFLQSSS